MRQGHWLILENVNRCSLSVLDRLNSLLESNGELLVNEGGGQGSTIKPHRHFRLLLTMDPQQGNGEISRAMRNRCCEIFIDVEQQPINRHDLQELLCSLHIDRYDDFIGMHQRLCSKGLGVRASCVARRSCQPVFVVVFQ
jgi:midasin